MEKNIEEKPITVKDFQEVIIPAMEEVFATKKDLENFVTKEDFKMFSVDLDFFKQEVRETFATKNDFVQFRNESFNYFDKILKDLDILMAEKEVGYYQKQKERKLWTIMIDALQKHQILSNDQIQEIKSLEIF